MLSARNFIRQPLTIALIANLMLLNQAVLAAAAPDPEKQSLQAIKERASELKTIISNYEQNKVGRAADADNARIDLLYLYMQEKNHQAVKEMVSQIVNKETFKPAKVLSLLQEYLQSNSGLQDMASITTAKAFFEKKTKDSGVAPEASTNDDGHDSSQNLQSGSYLYLGTNPGKQPVKAFSVNSLGEIIWQSNSKELLTSIKDQLPHDKMSSPQGAGIQQAGTENFETYSYPMIKWQPKPIPTMPGAFIQVLTTYDGKLKFKTTLFKATYLPRSMQIILLDQFGFKLCDVRIDQNDWTQLPGTNLYEARNDSFCSEQEYRKARDFSIR